MILKHIKPTHCTNNEFVEKGVLYNFKGKNNIHYLKMIDILDLSLRRPSNVKGVLHKHDKDGSFISTVRITYIISGRHVRFHPQTTFKRKVNILMHLSSSI